MTYYTTGVIVELPHQSDEAYQESLQKLPSHFLDRVITLGYHNGPIAATEMKRRVKSNHKDFEAEADKLLTPETIKLNDEIVIDRDGKGRQRLKRLGIRIRIEKVGSGKALGQGGVAGFMQYFWTRNLIQ